MTASSSEPAARLHSVTMRFREHTALDGVTAAFEENGITGLLGRNGAGKTTLMQLLTGHRVPTAGRVEVFGASPYENDDILRDICFVKEGQRYPDHFRISDALTAAAMLFPAWDADLAAALLADFDLPAKRPVKKLSRGMTSAVGIVIGLASRAPLTLFDEPYLGLDAVARQLFYDRLIADYAQHPRTVILSTHLIEEIAPLLERVLLLDRGRVLLDAEAESLGGHARAVVRTSGAPDRHAAAARGLTLEPTTLQQLVVALSLATPPRGAVHPVPAGARSDDLEEVS
jgi:ABC-2 type transport system ATP-binding protein